MVSKSNKIPGNLVKIVISNFIGCIIKRGNKFKARNLFLASMKLIRMNVYKEKINKNSLRKNSFVNSKLLLKSRLTNVFSSHMFPYFVLVKAVIKAAPKITLQSKRVGGVIYRLPKLIRNMSSSYFTGIRWIIKNARLRRENGFHVRLANEIIETYKGNSPTLRKKAELHRIAVLNRPFVRYLRKKRKKR